MSTWWLLKLCPTGLHTDTPITEGFQRGDSAIRHQPPPSTRVILKCKSPRPPASCSLGPNLPLEFVPQDRRGAPSLPHLTPMLGSSHPRSPRRALFFLWTSPLLSHPLADSVRQAQQVGPSPSQPSDLAQPRKQVLSEHQLNEWDEWLPHQHCRPSELKALGDEKQHKPGAKKCATLGGYTDCGRKKKETKSHFPQAARPPCLPSPRSWHTLLQQILAEHLLSAGPCSWLWGTFLSRVSAQPPTLRLRSLSHPPRGR